ncbi:MAG: Gfo/Idh/MocA family protein [Acidimicrobiales bacterium]
MTERRLGWGIVGLGRIVRSEIAPAIASLTNDELVAVTSRDQARAEVFAKEHGARRAYDDFEDMLADDDVNAVYIATPNAFHADQVIAAARAGKHVLCDKPLATTPAAAEAAVAACQESGSRLGITFQTRRHGGMTEAARIVADGSIGRVLVAEVEMSAGRNLPVGWRTDPALAGMGTLNNIGVHAIDLLRYILGSEVREVTCLVDREPGFEIDTTATVLMRFEQGTLAYVNANQSVAAPRDDVVLYGTEGRFIGANLSRPNREGSVSVVRAGVETVAQASSADSYRLTVDAFAQAVAEGREPSPGGIDGLRSVQVTDAISTALAEQRVVTVKY